MSKQEHTQPLEEIITLPKFEYDRLMILSKSMQGIEDPDYFMRNVKNELAHIRHDVELVSKGEYGISLLVHVKRRVNFLSSLFPKDQS